MCCNRTCSCAGPRKTALLVGVTASVALIATFLLPRIGEAPEVRLVRFTEQVERADTPKVRDDLPFSGFPEPDQDAWSCALEISGPKSGGIVMSHEQAKVEMAGPGGSWTAVALPKRPELPTWLLQGMRVCATRVEFTVPSETKCVRMTICCRPLTLEERVRQVLAKHGLGRRFPKVSRWTSHWLPRTEHWTEYRREFELPRVSTEVVAPEPSRSVH
jgi:hypothetical protein